MCVQVTFVQTFQSGQIVLQDGTAVVITESELENYGVTVDILTGTIAFQSDNSTLAEADIEITF